MSTGVIRPGSNPEFAACESIYALSKVPINKKRNPKFYKSVLSLTATVGSSAACGNFNDGTAKIHSCIRSMKERAKSEKKR